MISIRKRKIWVLPQYTWCWWLRWVEPRKPGVAWWWLSQPYSCLERDRQATPKSSCSTEEQCWNLLERTAQHYLCTFGFDRNGCLQICHLAKTNTRPLENSAAHVKSLGVHSETIEKWKYGWWFCLAEMFHEGYPWKTCDKGIWFSEDHSTEFSECTADILQGNGNSLISGQPILWQREHGSWMNYQKVPGTTL